MAAVIVLKCEFCSLKFRSGAQIQIHVNKTHGVALLEEATSAITSSSPSNNTKAFGELVTKPMKLGSASKISSASIAAAIKLRNRDQAIKIEAFDSDSCSTEMDQESSAADTELQSTARPIKTETAATDFTADSDTRAATNTLQVAAVKAEKTDIGCKTTGTGLQVLKGDNRASSLSDSSAVVKTHCGSLTTTEKQEKIDNAEDSGTHSSSDGTVINVKVSSALGTDYDSSARTKN